MLCDLLPSYNFRFSIIKPHVFILKYEKTNAIDIFSTPLYFIKYRAISFLYFQNDNWKGIHITAFVNIRSVLPEAVVLSISRVVVSNDAVVEDVAEVVFSSVVFPSTSVLATVGE